MQRTLDDSGATNHRTAAFDQDNLQNVEVAARSAAESKPRRQRSSIPTFSGTEYLTGNRSSLQKIREQSRGAIEDFFDPTANEITALNQAGVHQESHKYSQIHSKKKEAELAGDNPLQRQICGTVDEFVETKNLREPERGEDKQHGSSTCSHSDVSTFHAAPARGARAFSTHHHHHHHKKRKRGDNSEALCCQEFTMLKEKVVARVRKNHDSAEQEPTIPLKSPTAKSTAHDTAQMGKSPDSGHRANGQRRPSKLHKAMQSHNERRTQRHLQNYNKYQCIWSNYETQVQNHFDKQQIAKYGTA